MSGMGGVCFHKFPGSCDSINPSKSAVRSKVESTRWWHARHPRRTWITIESNCLKDPFQKSRSPGNSAGDLFWMVKCPFQRISDLQLGDKKVTLNHLVDDLFMPWK